PRDRGPARSVLAVGLACVVGSLALALLGGLEGGVDDGARGRAPRRSVGILRGSRRAVPDDLSGGDALLHPRQEEGADRGPGGGGRRGPRRSERAGTAPPPVRPRRWARGGARAISQRGERAASSRPRIGRREGGVGSALSTGSSGMHPVRPPPRRVMGPGLRR